MIRSTLAVMAVVATLGSQAEAAVYTTATAINVTGSDLNYSLPFNIFLPNFDSALGALNSVSFSLNGFVDQNTQFYSGIAPTTGVFTNQVQFNNNAPIALGTVAFRPSMAYPNAIEDTFTVTASSATYLASTGIADGSLSLSIDVGGSLQPTGCCAYTFVNLRGIITTTFDYTPVPEPISLALLSAPVIALGLIRRRA